MGRSTTNVHPFYLPILGLCSACLLLAAASPRSVSAQETVDEPDEAISAAPTGVSVAYSFLFDTFSSNTTSPSRGSSLHCVAAART